MEELLAVLSIKVACTFKKSRIVLSDINLNLSTMDFKEIYVITTI